MTEIHALLNEREKTHGSFEDNAETAQACKAAARRNPGWARKSAVEREAIDNIYLKLSRYISGEEGGDDLLDVKGYVGLIERSRWTNT